MADLALVFPPAAQKKKPPRPPNDFDGGESSFNRALASLRTSFQAKIALPPPLLFSIWGPGHFLMGESGRAAMNNLFLGLPGKKFFFIYDLAAVAIEEASAVGHAGPYLGYHTTAEGGHKITRPIEAISHWVSV